MTEAFTAVPVTGNVGADVSGVDLVADIDAATADQIEQALAEHGVLFFAPPSDGSVALKSLALALGDIVMPHPMLASLADEGRPEVGLISTGAGNNSAAGVWHSDVTWREEPSRYSVLHMVEAPRAGGDTMWLSQIKAFATLSRPMQDMLRALTATHVLDPLAPQCTFVHPVVIRHPRTGAESLFVNQLFTTRINELHPSESAALLDMLCRHSSQPEFVVRRRWRGGELAVWDNHFVQHYAVQDYAGHERCVNRIEVRAEAPVAA